MENGKFKIKNSVTLNLCFSEQMVFTSKTFPFLSAKYNFTLILYFWLIFSKKSKIVDYFLFSFCLNKKDFDKSSFFIKKENDLDAMCHGLLNHLFSNKKTFAQNRSIIISKALFISFSIQYEIYVWRNAFHFPILCFILYFLQ